MSCGGYANNCCEYNTGNERPKCEFIKDSQEGIVLRILAYNVFNMPAVVVEYCCGSPQLNRTRMH